MNYQILQDIQQATFFSELSPDSCKQLATTSARRDVKKRDTLFHEGVPGAAMFLLIEGSVQLHKTTADGATVVIRTIKPGDIFAEVILFEKNQYPVTAVATAPSTVLVFSKQDMLNLLEDPAFRNDFIAALMRKQRYLAERVRYLTSYDVEERFFRFLHDHYGDTTAITTDLSKKDMAAAIGATPETFSRMIKRLASDNAITWQGHNLTVAKDVWESYKE